MTKQLRHTQPVGRKYSILLRAMALAVVWWIITGGRTDSWMIGLPLILVAAYLSVNLSPPSQQVHWLALLKFIPFFLAESLRGGIDVARRVYSPTLPLTPSVLNYPLRLPEGTCRVFFSNSISLLPGTLGAGINNDVLRIHLLEKTPSVIKGLNELELKVANIFGVDLSNTEHNHEEHVNETL